MIVWILRFGLVFYGSTQLWLSVNIADYPRGFGSLQSKSRMLLLLLFPAASDCEAAGSSRRQPAVPSSSSKCAEGLEGFLRPSVEPVLNVCSLSPFKNITWIPLYDTHYANIFFPLVSFLVKRESLVVFAVQQIGNTFCKRTIPQTADRLFCHLSTLRAMENIHRNLPAPVTEASEMNVSQPACIKTKPPSEAWKPAEGK